MREIKFRAKMIDGTEWVIGGGVWTFKAGLSVLFGEDAKGNPILHRINPETVGEFTGLKDKNGREIYEGDIYRVDSEDPFCGTYPVVANETHGLRFMLGGDIICKADAIYGEVIGNIHENSEFLEAVK